MAYLRSVSQHRQFYYFAKAERNQCIMFLYGAEHKTATAINKAEY